MQRALGGADWRTIINRAELRGAGRGLAMPTCPPASLLNALYTYMYFCLLKKKHAIVVSTGAIHCNYLASSGGADR